MQKFNYRGIRIKMDDFVYDTIEGKVFRVGSFHKSQVKLSDKYNKEDNDEFTKSIVKEVDMNLKTLSKELGQDINEAYIKQNIGRRKTIYRIKGDLVIEPISFEPIPKIKVRLKNGNIIIVNIKE